MNRRVLTWGVLLAAAALLIAGIQGSYADDGGKTSRYKTVEIQATQYVWELVSGRDGHVVCQVVVEHPSRPTYDETIQICGDQIFPQGPTPTPIGTPAATRTPGPPAPTAAPFDLEAYFNSVYWRFVTTQELKRTIQVPLPEMIVNLTVPPNQKAPYQVIIAAYEPVYGQRITGISGLLDGVEFTCTASRCVVPIQRDSTLEFWATSSFGDESKHLLAVLRLNNIGGTTTLEIASIQPISLYTDNCSLAWGLPRINVPTWGNLPPSPDDLATMKPYQYLAGQLITRGLVDAKDCPGGGLQSNGGPNTCGLTKAAPAVIDWQNQFDVAIWKSGLDLGVPPQVIKTLIEQESQFWPANGQRGIFEYGLGQLSPTGADVVLRWDNELFTSVCNGLLFDCSKVYGRLPTWAQATVRGGLMRNIDAECPGCSTGYELATVYDSIPVLTRTLRANCYQTGYIMGRRKLAAFSYEDMWRFTLVSYHSGYSCLADAVTETAAHSLPVDWEHVSGYLTCPGSIEYVENFWKSLTEFDKFRLKQVNGGQPLAEVTFKPTVQPTPTQTPVTPTPVPVLSHVRVLVYVDSNGNNYPEPGERTNGVKVTATFADGQVMTANTVNGEVVFDLKGRTVGEEVTISLPDLYRSAKIRTIRDGEIPVVFRLEEPVVPPVLP